MGNAYYRLGLFLLLTGLSGCGGGAVSLAPALPRSMTASAHVGVSGTSVTVGPIQGDRTATLTLPPIANPGNAIFTVTFSVDPPATTGSRVRLDSKPFNPNGPAYINAIVTPNVGLTTTIGQNHDTLQNGVTVNGAPYSSNEEGIITQDPGGAGQCTVPSGTMESTAPDHNGAGYTTTGTGSLGPSADGQSDTQTYEFQVTQGTTGDARKRHGRRRFDESCDDDVTPPGTSTPPPTESPTSQPTATPTPAPTPSASTAPTASAAPTATATATASTTANMATNCAIVTTNCRLYIANGYTGSSANGVYALSPPYTGTPQLLAGTSGVAATNIAFDTSGNLYVADYDTSTLNEYAPPYAGTSVASIASNSGTPRGIAFDAKSNLYLDDTNGVLAFAPPYTGAPYATISANGTYGLRMDTSYNLFVGPVNGANGILEYAPPYDGNATTVAPGQASQSFVFDSQKRLFALYEGGNSALFSIYAPPYTGQASITIPAYSSITYPLAIAVDHSANVYIADYYAGTFIFTPPYTGTPTQIAPSIPHPADLYFAP